MVAAATSGSYKKRAMDKTGLYPVLLKEIEAKLAKLRGQKKWDQSSKEYKDYVVKVARERYKGTAANWSKWEELLRNHSEALWSEGCPAPEIRGVVAEIKLKPNAKPVARRPYRLSEFDEARLECRL